MEGEGGVDVGGEGGDEGIGEGAGWTGLRVSVSASAAFSAPPPAAAAPAVEGREWWSCQGCRVLRPQSAAAELW